MFYSQTFLARKGPLGTVWCAAHLQHRLKKSHYASTNIPKTVDLIMCPEVPLALRMSGHLLLGVVRIYSKKVDYLFRDCNAVLTWLAKAFVSTKVDLPDEARQAPVESVTLPETLSLDDFNLDADTTERGFDDHLRSQEEITLADQIPTGTDPFVAVTFDEETFQDIGAMNIDIQSTMPLSGNTEAQPGNSNDAQAEVNPTQVLNTQEIDPNSPQSAPEIERMRDATHEFSPGMPPSFAQEQGNDTVEPPGLLDETLNKQDDFNPVLDEEILDSARHSAFELNSGSPAFVIRDEEPLNFSHSSPQLILQPSPPQAQQQAEPIQRKRKLFDKATVLTNKVMKQRLEDPSDTLRKKRSMPSTSRGVWRINKRLRKEQAFDEPLLTGLSEDLSNVFRRDYVASKPNLAVIDEIVEEQTSVLSPTQNVETEVEPDLTNLPSAAGTSTYERVQQSPAREAEIGPDSTVPRSPNPWSEATAAHSFQSFRTDEMEIERLRDGGGGFTEFMDSPIRFSPARTDEYTPQPGTSGTSTTVLSSHGTDSGTWRTIPEDRASAENSGLSDIPEIDEELSFLETGNDTPGRSPASAQSDSLSVRTRALALYLKERPSCSPTSRSSTEGLSLKKLLEGKRRKVAARMFFETLVLKSKGLIDVEQDEAYGDITLKLMPSLFSKAQL